MKPHLRPAPLAAVFALVSAAHAQVAVPNAYATTSSGTAGLNTFIRDVNAPRAGQLLINANQLTSLVGSQINGLTFRLFRASTVAYPAAAATWADYTISAGVGVP